MNNKAIIQAMKQRVYEANLALPKLVIRDYRN